MTNIARGGFLRLRTDFVERSPLPTFSDSGLARGAETCGESASQRMVIERAVARRILDLAPPNRRKLTAKLRAWPALDFAGFRAEVRQAFGADVPLKERGEWEAYLAEQGAEVRRLTAAVADAEREIDRIVYDLFDLNAAEIALLEGSLAGRR